MHGTKLVLKNTLHRMKIAGVCIALSCSGALACEQLGWDQFLHPGPQDFKVSEEIKLSNGTYISAVKFGRPKGPYSKTYLFMLFNGECSVAAVSLGSYASTVAYSGDIRFHLDLYERDAHSTLDMYKRAPSYQKIKRLAVKTLTEISNQK